ncbi:hypothetical protein UVI_02029300 [Ustilaginoidea virens]|uniref:NIMA interactive protein n=1 Tax=Ustilaginoidea virens TaxID=1159556 RepID=A0A1B5KYH3_USTVR|nr:hypothetical protein UVI_02029300 [Ustilaginoidea virens]
MLPLWPWTLTDLDAAVQRDAEQRESLSTAMRALRAENLKLASDVARLADKHAEAQRKADIAAASETTLRTQLKSAEANAKALKDEVARMKSLVAQCRASCATEIRRRDRQMDTLKKQLGEAGRSRGSRGNPAITTITVAGEVGRRGDNTTTSAGVSGGGVELDGETNASLANLARHVAEENEVLLAMLQRAMAELRDMSGWQGDDDRAATNPVRRNPTCQDVAAELDPIMDHVRLVLTNPSFVPIEEVVMREEEINRLRCGWLKMEARWKDAVHLMDSWRKRMAAGGKPVCDEELQAGLRLSPVRARAAEGTRGAGDVGLSAVKEECEEQADELLRSPCPANGEHGDGPPDGSESESEGDMTDYEDVAAADRPLSIPGGGGGGGGGGEDGQEAAKAPGGQDAEAWHLQHAPLLDAAPRPSPLEDASSAGNRGVSHDDETRSQRGRVVSTKGGTAGGDSGAKSGSMRCLPVRPRAAASQSRLSSRAPRDAGLQLPGRDAEVSAPDGEGGPTGQETQTTGPARTAAAAATKTATTATTAAAAATTSPTTATATATATATTSQCSMNDATAAGAAQTSVSPATRTIAAKLAASEKDADAARVRAKLKAARTSTRGVSRPPMALSTASEPAFRPGAQSPPADGAADAKQPGDGAGRPAGKRKRDRQLGKTASRRRSTLSPRELETLISGRAEGAAAGRGGGAM